MSDEIDEGKKKTKEQSLVQTLSESSPVRLTLAISMCLLVWWASQTLSGLSTKQDLTNASIIATNAKIDANAQVQGARMSAQDAAIERLSLDIRDLSTRVRDLEKGKK